MINLFEYQDIKYRDFHKRILNNENINVIGIRTPILKNIAKSLANSNYKDYININQSYYEQTLIHGLILGYIKVPFKELLNELDIFIPKIDNWATNDLVCANLKAFKTNQEEGYKYILKLLKNKKPWHIRFGLVLLLDYYINDEYIDLVLDICLNTKSDNYYINMANSWLISICYIKYKNKTYNILLNKDLDEWVKNKAISKICDSYRVDKTDKENIKKIRKSSSK